MALLKALETIESLKQTNRTGITRQAICPASRELHDLWTGLDPASRPSAKLDKHDHVVRTRTRGRMSPMSHPKSILVLVVKRRSICSGLQRPKLFPYKAGVAGGAVGRICANSSRFVAIPGGMSPFAMNAPQVRRGAYEVLRNKPRSNY